MLVIQHKACRQRVSGIAAAKPLFLASSEPHTSEYFQLFGRVLSLFTKGFHIIPACRVKIKLLVIRDNDHIMIFTGFRKARRVDHIFITKQAAHTINKDSTCLVSLDKTLNLTESRSKDHIQRTAGGAWLV